MTPAQRQLVDDVAARLGPAVVVTDPAAIAPWLIDWRQRYHGVADAILSPATTAEVAAIVGRARSLGVALVPQGGNTSMVGGATPPADGSALILSLRRMNRIRAVDAAANLAVTEAGVVLATLHAAANDAGRRFPLNLGASGSATIGGLISTNAGGTQVLRFGTMRSLVAGLEAVLPDGSVHDNLAALKKDNRGYSLDHLLIGAEGTLGIVTAASLKLVPAIAARAVAWLGLTSPQAALDMLRALEAATDGVESFELIPGDTIARALRHIPGLRPPLAGDHPWHVLVEAVATDAADEPPAALLERLLAPAIERGHVADAVVAASEAQADAFWRIRDALSEAERRDGPATQHDISVSVADMPRFLLDAARAVEARFAGVSASGFGHLGDGNIHFHVRAPAGGGEGWYAANADPVTRFVDDLVTAAGGSISAEHGIGQMKRAEFERLAPPSRLAALRAVRLAFDPAGILNPGKLLSPA